jgi:hypothetical protein
VVKNALGSVFSARFDGLTARRDYFRDCGGVFLATMGWMLIDSCVMIAKERLEACVTTDDGFCNFVRCEFHPNVIFICDGSIEKCIFHGGGFSWPNDYRMENKGCTVLEEQNDVLRFSLSDLRSCPRNGMSFIKHTLAPVEEMRDLGEGEKRRSPWWIATVISIAVAMILFCVA